MLDAKNLLHMWSRRNYQHGSVKVQEYFQSNKASSSFRFRGVNAERKIGSGDERNINSIKAEESSSLQRCAVLRSTPLEVVVVSETRKRSGIGVLDSIWKRR